jgi:DNA-directed RNA polymerase specialized sigma24 family protein
MVPTQAGGLVGAHGGATGDDALLLSERVRLVRLCARLTGDADAAEDLAHEALVLA